jgi:replicative DNA helicase
MTETNNNDVDTLQKFGTAFQSKTIRALIDDKSFLDRTHDIIETMYWESEANKWIVSEILKHYDVYKRTATLDVFKIKCGDITIDSLRAEVVDNLRTIFTQTDTNDAEFVKNEFLNFCKNQKLKNAIMQSVDFLKGGQYDSIKRIVDDALKAGTERNMGHDYLKDVELRMSETARDTINTGWEVIDDLTNGGLGPGELGVIISSAGGGKSWCLASLGKSAMLSGKNVLHYTLELNECYVGLRYDSCFTGVPFQDIVEEKEKVKNIISNIKGQLLIKEYPTKGVGVSTILAHANLAKTMGYPVDMVVIDYADILSPGRVGNNANTYVEQGGIYEDLRGLAGELQVPVWTASQASRSSLDDNIIEAQKVADSYRKIMTADFVISLSRKATDKVSNTGRFHVIKNRFGADGMTFPSRVDTSSGVIEIYDEKSTKGAEIMVEMNDSENGTKNILKSKYDQMNNKNSYNNEDVADIG